jgi:hypothetical protein
METCGRARVLEITIEHGGEASTSGGSPCREELKALDEFIAYKTRYVERLQNVEKNLQAIEEIE